MLHSFNETKVQAAANDTVQVFCWKYYQNNPISLMWISLRNINAGGSVLKSSIRPTPCGSVALEEKANSPNLIFYYIIVYELQKWLCQHLREFLRVYLLKKQQVLFLWQQLRCEKVYSRSNITESSNVHTICLSAQTFLQSSCTHTYC